MSSDISYHHCNRALMAELSSSSRYIIGCLPTCNQPYQYPSGERKKREKNRKKKKKTPWL
jgi:hypothetical protein